MHTEAKRILTDFCEALNVKQEDVLSNKKHRELSDARFIIVTEIKKRLEGAHTLATIGSWFNKPVKSQHSFVIYCEKQANMLKDNKLFKEKYKKCLETVFDISIYNHIPQY